MPRIDLIQPRGGTAAQWTSVNPVLENQEYGYETDTRLHKYGDGVTAWNDLPYAGEIIPTIQEVLTAGDEVAGDQKIRFIKQQMGVDVQNDFLFSGTSFGSIYIDNVSGVSSGIISALTGYKLFYDDGVDICNLLLRSNSIIADKVINYDSDLSADFTSRTLPDVEWVNAAILEGDKEIATYSATTTTTTTLDCDTFDSTYQVITTETDFRFINTPALGESFVKTIEFITTASEIVTFKTADKVIGTPVNDNTTVNMATINFANYPTIGLRVTVSIIS